MTSWGAMSSQTALPPPQTNHLLALVPTQRRRSISLNFPRLKRRLRPHR